MKLSDDDEAYMEWVQNVLNTTLHALRKRKPAKQQKLSRDHKLFITKQTALMKN